MLNENQVLIQRYAQLIYPYKDVRNNIILLERNATFAKTLKYWKDYGRDVIAGSKAIWLMGARGMFPVFDWTQTKGDEMRLVDELNRCQEAFYKSNGWKLEKLTGAIKRIGFEVISRKLMLSQEYIVSDKMIQINELHLESVRFKSLVKAFGELNGLTESDSEALACLVCSRFCVRADFSLDIQDVEACLWRINPVYISILARF